MLNYNLMLVTKYVLLVFLCNEAIAKQKKKRRKTSLMQYHFGVNVCNCVLYLNYYKYIYPSYRQVIFAEMIFFFHIWFY